ncbi:MAG: hypothetical protein JSW51_09265 [Gemmatimonadota bacterium]|nr:MAG: hypothetical protein JSW51_09265 [Gemmatimonadota bacterium]
MKLEDLVRELRRTLNDFGPYIATDEEWVDDDADMLWKNAELTTYIQRAEEEYTRRYPIPDDTTAAVCTVTVTATQPYVTLDPRVLQVDRIKLSTGTKAIKRITVDELDETLAESWEAEAGEPTHYIFEHHELRLRLYPIPTTTGTAALRVGRKALRPLRWDYNHRHPEIPENHHLLLLDWAAHLAYLKDDTEDTYDVKRAGTFRDIFNANVGGDISVKAQEARRQLAGTRVPRTRAYDR